MEHFGHIPRSTQPSILCVDDHETVRASLCDWLALHLPGWRMVEAGSGEEALFLAQQHRPSVVLMDILLPGMNGLEAARNLQRALPGVPVIILSMLESNPYKLEAAAAGAVAFVPKRVMHSELLPLLHKVLV